jgi:nucleolar complex protein 2
MYVTYVRNTRFISPGNLANISFMRLSLVELFAVDEAAAYQQAFLYIRQLAIHLRNAVRVHKKVNFENLGLKFVAVLVFLGNSSNSV